MSTDNILGGRLAARHLVRTGHQRIALLSGWAASSTSRDRQFGFEQKLQEQGRSLFAHEAGHSDQARSGEAVLNLMDQRPDAIFAANDCIAIEALSALRSEPGLRVPEGTSVIGFDEIPMAGAPEYYLTAFRRPVNRMAEQAVCLMLQAIAKTADAVGNTLLQRELIE